MWIYECRTELCRDYGGCIGCCRAYVGIVRGSGIAPQQWSSKRKRRLKMKWKLGLYYSSFCSGFPTIARVLGAVLTTGIQYLRHIEAPPFRIC